MSGRSSRKQKNARATHLDDLSDEEGSGDGCQQGQEDCVDVAPAPRPTVAELHQDDAAHHDGQSDDGQVGLRARQGEGGGQEHEKKHRSRERERGEETQKKKESECMKNQ